MEHVLVDSSRKIYIFCSKNISRLSRKLKAAGRDFNPRFSA